MATFLILDGCAAAPRSVAPAIKPEPQAAVLSTAPPTPPVLAAIPEGGTCTVVQVVALARERTPTRTVLRANLAAAKAAVLQAQAHANPEIELEAGQGRPRQDDGSETIGRISLRQRLELPGKRSSRVDAAAAGIAVVEQDALAWAVDLEALVREAIIEDASAAMAATQAAGAAELATQIAATVQHRVTAGEGDRGDALRAELDRRQVTISAEQKQQAATAARQALRAICGGGLPTTFTISDAWENGWNPTEAEVQQAAEHHPHLERWRALRQQRTAELQREESSARPDVTLGAFAGQATDATEIGLTMAIDIPVFDRNQGGIAGAQAELQRNLAEAEADRRQVLQSIQAAWAAFQAATHHRDRLLAEVEPLTADLLKLRLNAYATGDIGLLEVLEARRTHQALGEDLLASRTEVARARIQLFVALGRFASTDPVPSSEAHP